ncbi:M23 family metallopeptidase [Stenotrophomonas sp. CFBP 13725]|uniref:M23 family metallopeptidase n=1 Tax=Stenotrophomonas sp. CFBP 13725 TaxID=2775297 RepID=UPI00177FF531|nr:M23 family metallopeptidase [Stenotrophomonas sp. CFBP 13725]MBD8634313.1 M23 family metallopeptidase [Stenotrophomonas sp. CFBP 13725]
MPAIPLPVIRFLMTTALALLQAPAPVSAATPTLVVVPEPIALAPMADTAPKAPGFHMPLAEFRLSSAFGPRRHPIRGRAHAHSGADMAAARGTPVHAIAEGTVAAVRELAKGYGRHVVVDHADGYSSWYAHLDRIDAALHVGSIVRAGQRLGSVGSTGSATGPHLHLEIRQGNIPLEPMALLQPMPVPAPAVIGVAPAWRAHAAPP